MAVFYLASMPRSVGSMPLVVNFTHPLEGLRVYSPPLQKSLSKKAAVLYKAATVEVKFRTILK
jgi:hypothetical protein